MHVSAFSSTEMHTPWQCIQVGDWHTLNEEVRSRLGNKTVMVLTRNQQPRPECGHCSQPSQVAYFRYYPNYGTLHYWHPHSGRHDTIQECLLGQGSFNACHRNLLHCQSAIVSPWAACFDILWAV